MHLGYARVGAGAQDLTNQRAEFAAAGRTKLFSEKITGAQRHRPELALRLDRLAHSTRLQSENPGGLRSLTEPWADTTTPAGRIVLTVLPSLNAL